MGRCGRRRADKPLLSGRALTSTHPAAPVRVQLAGVTLTILRRPGPEDMRAIERWLEQEYVATGEGFWVNINVIRKAAHDREIMVARVGGLAVAFLVWGNAFPERGVIDILEVAPQFRERGIGRALYLNAEAMLRGRGVTAIRGKCSPASSEAFWRKLGFESDVERVNRDSLHPRMVKLL